MDDVAKKESIGSESFPLLGGARGEESFWNEIIRTWALAWPVVCTFFLQVGPGIISLMFVGHLPKKEYLAACTLATMYIHMTGNTVVIGMSTALDTLLSQAYGSGQLTKVRGFSFFFIVLRVFNRSAHHSLYLGWLCTSTHLAVKRIAFVSCVRFITCPANRLESFSSAQYAF
jgi:Na+-driven multidrug efflux pump